MSTVQHECWVWDQPNHTRVYRDSRKDSAHTYGEAALPAGSVGHVCVQRYGSDVVHTFRVDRTRLRTVVTLIAESRGVQASGGAS